MHRPLFDGQPGERRAVNPIDKASMQGVIPGAAIVIRRIVVIAVTGAVLVELKRVGK